MGASKKIQWNAVFYTVQFWPWHLYCPKHEGFEMLRTPGQTSAQWAYWVIQTWSSSFINNERTQCGVFLCAEWEQTAEALLEWPLFMFCITVFMFSYLATTHALWSYSNLPAQRTILRPMLLHKTPCFYIPELRVHIEPIRYEHLSRLAISVVTSQWVRRARLPWSTCVYNSFLHSKPVCFFNPAHYMPIIGMVSAWVTNCCLLVL